MSGTWRAGGPPPAKAGFEKVSAPPDRIGGSGAWDDGGAYDGSAVPGELGGVRSRESNSDGCFS